MYNNIYTYTELLMADHTHLNTNFPDNNAGGIFPLKELFWTYLQHDNFTFIVNQTLYPTWNENLN